MRRELSTRRSELRVAGVLLLRAVANATLAVWMMAVRPDWGGAFDAFSRYAIVDGLLGLGLAIAVAGAPSVRLSVLVAGITAVDALARITGAIALRALPGLYGFPVTLALLFGAAGAVLSALGLLGFATWMSIQSRRVVSLGRSRYSPLDTLAPAALLSTILGFVLIIEPPATESALRVAAAIAGGTLAIVFAFAAAGFALAGRRRARCRRRVLVFESQKSERSPREQLT